MKVDTHQAKALTEVLHQVQETMVRVAVVVQAQ
jgi:hypothetical protein